MQRSLILAWGIELPELSKQQISKARNCLQHLSSDPRVRTVYGGNGNGRGTGLVVMTETRYPQESQQVANLLQVSGFSNVETIHLVEGQAFMAGLQEAEKIAGLIPEPIKAGVGGEL